MTGSPPSRPAVAQAVPHAGGRRYAELQAYRGLAALLIVVFHAYQFSREGTGARTYVYQGTPLHLFFGNLEAGVDWFFVLSGFLLFLPFAGAATSRHRPPAARGFLIRRLLRIVPAYYVAILLVWVLRYSGTRDSWLDLFQHLTFTQIFDQKHIFWTIGPAWFVSVELIFCLCLAGFGPLAYRACRPLATPGARLQLLAGACTAFVVISVVYKWWASSVAQVPQDHWPVYFGPVAKLDTFALGMLLAVIVTAIGSDHSLTQAARRWLWLSGLALLIVTFGLRSHSAAVDLYFHTLAAGAAVLILAATVLGPRGSVWERLLARRVFQYLGLISYSVYLWHEPIMLELSKRNILLGKDPRSFPGNAITLMVLSIGIGMLSYVIVERPFMRFGRFFTRDGRLARLP